MTPYYNHESEKYLIGALLQDPQIQTQLPGMPEDLMHDPGNLIVLETMRRMQQRKEPIELLSVSNRLLEFGKSEEIGGNAYLLACVRACPSTANARHYLNELRGLTERRRLFTLLNTATHRLSDGEETIALMDEVRTSLRNMATPKNTVVRASEVAHLTYEDIEKRARGETVALQTRIPDLDALIVGLEASDLMVIGARPAVGKSALGLDIAVKVAQSGGRVMIVSREMNQIQYGHRITSHLSGVNGQRLKRGTLDAEDWARVAAACDELSGLPIRFEFELATVEDVRVMVQHEKDVGGLDLLVVDYLQILETSAKKGGKRYEEVGAVSRALKTMALDLHTPVIALAQVGRQNVGTGRTPRKPVLSDLRESGNIENDADIVVFIHHPADENDADIPQGDRENGMYAAVERLMGHEYQLISVDKQRQGQCGSFGIDFDPAHMTYTCFAR